MKIIQTFVVAVICMSFLGTAHGMNNSVELDDDMTPVSVRNEWKKVQRQNEESAKIKGDVGRKMYSGEPRECTCGRVMRLFSFCIYECFGLCHDANEPGVVYDMPWSDERGFWLNREEKNKGSQTADELYREQLRKFGSAVVTAAKKRDTAASSQVSPGRLPPGQQIPWMTGPKFIDVYGYVYRLPIHDLNPLERETVRFVTAVGGWRIDEHSVGLLQHSSEGERETHSINMIERAPTPQVMGDPHEIMQPLLRPDQLGVAGGAESR